jgi:hypothetical protein
MREEDIRCNKYYGRFLFYAGEESAMSLLNAILAAFSQIM